MTNVAATSGGKAVNLTLASSGTYTILAHASNYNITGSYTLSIQSRTGGGCAGTTVAGGQTVNASTSFATEMDAYGFGTDGGTVIFSFSGYGGAELDLYDPTGTRLFTADPGSAPRYCAGSRHVHAAGA